MNYWLLLLILKYSSQSWIEVYNSTSDPVFGKVDYPSFGVISNNLFIYGGISDNSSIDTSKGTILKSFNVSVQKYTSVSLELENRIHNKSSFAYVESGDTYKSFHFGGYGDNGLTNDLQEVNCDITNNNCTVDTISEQSGVTPSERYGSILLYYKNKLYLFGGKGEDRSRCDNEIYEYDINSNKWNKIPILHDGAKPPCRYYSSGSVYIDENSDNTKDYILLYGGINTQDDGDYYSDVWKFSFTEKNWKEIKVTGPKLKRAFHSSNFIDERFIVHGGYKIGDKVNTISGDTLVLQPNEKEPEWLIADKVNLPRYKHTAVVLNSNYVVITGGRDVNNRNVEGLYMLYWDEDSISLKTPAYENIPEINPLMYIALIFPIIISVIIPLILCLASYREGMIITNFQQTMEGMGIRPGVPQSILDNLTIRNYHKDKDSEYDTCPICLVEFNENEQVKELPCKHLFHPPCVDTWLNVSQLCPMCKSSVLSSQQEEERREHLQNNIEIEQQRIFEILENSDIDPNDSGINRILERNNYIPQHSVNHLNNNNNNNNNGNNNNNNSLYHIRTSTIGTSTLMSTTSAININTSGNNRRSHNDYSRYNESYPTPLIDSINNNSSSVGNSNTRRHLTPSSPIPPPSSHNVDTLRSHSRYSGSSNGNENENKEERVLNGPPKDMEDI